MGTLCANLTRSLSNELYRQVLRDNDVPAMRKLCRYDLFFLLTIAFKRKDVNQDWLYDRCREVETFPDDRLDLWAREHYKSTIITYAKSIQDILKSHGEGAEGQEECIGIFSHTKGIARAFLKQIKRELEENEFLKDLFPDVLYQNPQKESPQWSVDQGIIVKRTGNPKEGTVEAWGLVDGQPTSKHYTTLVFDDVVTIDSVTTPEMIEKTTEAWRLSLNLGAHGGKRRIIGTRYHFNDTYNSIIKQKSAITRCYPATKDGSMDGEPVFLTRKALEEKRRDFGPYVFGCQMLQNPKADKAMGFMEEWIRRYDTKPDYTMMNVYITVDPASGKHKKTDYTVMWVWGLGYDGNYYLIDGIRDRLNLTARTRQLFSLVRKYRPVKVGYEEYGLQADIDHIKETQDRESYRFEIVALGGRMPKNNRILRLVPLYEQGRVWLPHWLKFKDAEGNIRDFVREFIEDEYLPFPVCAYDDTLDCSARILDDDLGAVHPRERKKDKHGRVIKTQQARREYDIHRR